MSAVLTTSWGWGSRSGRRIWVQDYDEGRIFRVVACVRRTRASCLPVSISHCGKLFRVCLDAHQDDAQLLTSWSVRKSFADSSADHCRTAALNSSGSTVPAEGGGSCGAPPTAAELATAVRVGSGSVELSGMVGRQFRLVDSMDGVTRLAASGGYDEATDW